MKVTTEPPQAGLGTRAELGDCPHTVGRGRRPAALAPMGREQDMLHQPVNLRRRRPAAIVLGWLLIGALCLTPVASQSSSASTPTGSLPITPAGLDVYAPAWQQPVSRAAHAPLTPPDGVDLEVTFIQRTPAYHRYCVDYSSGKPLLCAGTENEQRWPAPGESVTFSGHIRNQGTQPTPTFDYAWAIDDSVVLTGSLPSLAAGAETTVSYTWLWSHLVAGERVLDDHTVTLTVDPAGLVAETYETNNALRDYTNAMTLKFNVTPAMMTVYAQSWGAQWPFSAENWFQRQIAAMNWALANAVYPLTPDGARLRVRLDVIAVSDEPPVVDRQHDGAWFIDSDYRTYSGGYDPATDIDWNLVHELSHQIGLIDLYTYNVFDSTTQVADQWGYPINFSDFWARPDLMGGGDIAPYTEWYRYSSHTAGGAAATAGYRRGYYGEYQFDIPQQVTLELLDNSGQPAAGVTVTLYQRNGSADWVGDIRVDNTPEISGLSGPDGRFALPNRSVGGDVTTATGHTLHDNPFGLVDVVGQRNRFLVSLQQDIYQEFYWLDVTDLNLAYWAGATDSYTLTLNTHLPAAGAPTAPHFTIARVQNFSQTLCWGYADSAPQSVVGYHVYRIAPPEFATYERVAEAVAGPCYTRATGDTGLDYAVFAVTALDDQGRESGFSPLRWLPSLVWVSDVQRRADGNLLVLDRHFGRILLQQPDGRYLQPLNSPHFGLVGVDYFAVNAENRLYISSPYPNPYIQTTTPDFQPDWAFGFNEFANPRGINIAAAPTCTFGGPYAADEHTWLLLHLNDSYNGAQGEQPVIPPTTSFTTGRIGSGVLVDDMDTLLYMAAGNLNRAQGAIEMWFRPNWAGNDGQNYVLFEAGNSWFNRLRIAKDGANNLRFMMWDDHAEYGASFSVADWQAGDWHHIAVTWKGSVLWLYVDGIPRSLDDDAHPPLIAPNQLGIGWSLFDGTRAHGVLDEVRISDIPRVGNSDVCQPLVFIADAFPYEAGRLAVYREGSEISSNYNVIHPEGVTVTSDGRIIVADAGDHRLHVYTLVETTLVWLRDLAADLSAPTHLTAHDNNYLVVADTGHNTVKVLYNEMLYASYSAPNDGSGGMFNQPLGVATLPDGSIVVADSGNQRVVQLRHVLPPLPQPHPMAIWLPINIKH